MPSWQEEYQRKLTSAEEAAGLVKSGDLVAFTAGREAHAVGLAIAARLGDLTGVKVLAPSPGYDFGWYDPGWDAAFEITISWPTATAQDMLDERRCDINLPLIIPFGADNVSPNVLLTEVSMPDERGFLQFRRVAVDQAPGDRGREAAGRDSYSRGERQTNPHLRR